ncbi:hypothetical protein J6590_004055, partial [Homalodisca vitripennis]
MHLTYRPYMPLTALISETSGCKLITSLHLLLQPSKSRNWCRCNVRQTVCWDAPHVPSLQAFNGFNIGDIWLPAHNLLTSSLATLKEQKLVTVCWDAPHVPSLQAFNGFNIGDIWLPAHNLLTSSLATLKEQKLV